MSSCPQKRLLTKDDMEIWDSSQTKKELINFITDLAEAVKDRDNTQFKEPISAEVSSTLALLDSVLSVVDEHPVLNDTTSRFGKTEFRSFYQDVKSNCHNLLSKAFDTLTTNQIEQLSIYFYESWGNEERIDYGSGHELNFICFLYGLYKYDVFRLERDSTNIVILVFVKYLKIMRRLETLYWLEPAGSHGVWGLDDYHFLPFLFGAFQLSNHKHLKPKSIHNDEIVDMFKDKYLYFGCIAFINSVKTTASLRWHSPMLDDISGVKKWSKVSEGMIKMYVAEVLSKLPVMQHFYFSEFLACPTGISPYDERNEHLESEHVHSGWGDCCGIKIPSAVAATEMNKKGAHYKPMPFD
ncbi:hypothetical protein KAFR_0H02440 [Kazachstania africana CBS 2517]|uniref:Serine/threonine-protein phosphatase 2A activator n=1 Tax=Kazachstania africana (strain ATCC 22294 / BCRC 22015 / CBS 2517 / CECT 1963 / NBRC 1671 / NRRL Y-8276) TaxID=1071382 RepID=H2AZ97_KAZAF|nr:hypothetical protein KAFR_0H02440 [Kazachstania africana CBS 2517]CCF59653.1 hypothetical protein KAFR_0H02440 [Kazachstania africana CBS 2517]